MRELTFLKAFETVAFLGTEDGGVMMFHPSFANDEHAPIKRDAVPVNAHAVKVARGAVLDMRRYIMPTSKPFIEGGDGSYVQVECAFDDVEKVWYVRESA